MKARIYQHPDEPGKWIFQHPNGIMIKCDTREDAFAYFDFYLAMARDASEFSRALSDSIDAMKRHSAVLQ